MAKSPKRIIIGEPGGGKTYFAAALVEKYLTSVRKRNKKH